ncbi:undecaprenyldiphospho-muramoylpentapeptide beta-N-acetylglucosaminyltransferase [Pseudokineococcus lusitanus]|uniref:UDP-N-acetylglucosamine--N-acetylmuramyl-(pentapeptide) pyrophosphoryl-undecaprenol N-acetylglucosamine transferase n=1 Tax=Pseudokineococcus lusitanus TaxID=763993 RepID=A0A3N1HKN0_9ACTN|nr:undecaprenyldiphospho-muramoylpentapeptide beta-N-acetylglucosaminyltransferase [Pseudokineococcus lusitanus]ROP43087.1 UDP-N-acetylglucosamine-N-acetylmuramylpentapeptide N-acetylglucosamine transferase [Pseudokineococcus lusitanus]
MSAAGAAGRPPSVLLAGGGTAGHVNPMLALADAVRRRHPDAHVLALGTAEGLEARLVPARGYELALVPRVPLPRRPSRALLSLPGRLGEAVSAADRAVAGCGPDGADVVVGMGGYVAVPAYLAARRRGVPVVVHEQNARPGIANKLGARLTRHVATTFPGTPLPHAVRVGLPMSPAVAHLDRGALRAEARAAFDLHPERPTLLVFGGSLGAQRLNEAVAGAWPDLAAADVQVLHLTGAGKEVPVLGTGADGPVHRVLPYTDRMDLAYAAADVALCRAGAGTVCEVGAVGLPAAFVPLPIGNGEQRRNAEPVVGAGGALLVDDADLDAAWLRAELLPVLADPARRARMGAAAQASAVRDADDRLADLVLAAAGRA